MRRANTFLHSAYSRGVLAIGGQIQAFYATGYRCLYPDFRGHGRTRCKNMKWNSVLIAEDMMCFLDKMKIEKINLIGYSTGGEIDSVGADNFLPEELLRQGANEFIENMKLLHADAHRGEWQE